MRVRWNLVALSALTIASAAWLAACGNQSAPATNGAGETATKPAETKPAAATDSEAAKGKLVFLQTGCNACHMNPNSAVKVPDITKTWGSDIMLEDGRVVKGDEAYIRESILNPGAKIHKGYQNLMPPYQGQVSEEQLVQLIAYIQSLADSSTGGN